MPAAVVLGARHLGGAIIDRLVADGYSVAGVVQSDDTLEAIRARGATGLRADARDGEQLAGALAEAREQLGGLDLIVNAISVVKPRPGEPHGGGPIAEGTLDDYRHWGVPIGELAFVFLSEGARALRAGGSGGTLIQVTNSASRRADPGMGMWAAGHHALRALVTSAAQELREEGIRVCLMRVDGPIESAKTVERLKNEGIPREAATDQDEIAAAVAYLATADDRAMTYELAVTASGRPPMIV
jgi:NAD(P)-dependent dehydrogenase (short-subunit alcohol dehydrogenase family)